MDKFPEVQKPSALDRYGSRTLVLLMMLAAGVFFGGSLYAVRSEEVRQSPKPLPVNVVRVHEQDSFVATHKYAGRIATGQVSDLGFQLSGELVELLVNEGSQVKAGAALARLDTARAEENLTQLKAQRNEADSALQQAESSLRRVQDLIGKGFANQQDLDDRKAQRDGLRSRIVAIESNIRVAERDLEDSTLYAPFAGQILQRFVDQGSVVQAGQPVLRLNQSGALEARIGVPVNARKRVSEGERFKLTAGGLEAEGVVTALVSDVNTGTRTLTAILQIENDPGFVPSDLVRLELDEIQRQTGIWVPAHALNEGLRGLWSVYVAVPAGEQTTDESMPQVHELVRKDVEILAVQSRQIYVRGTLEDGDLVVADSTMRFVPGQLVSVVSNTTLPEAAQPEERVQ
ncbi:efflux RND transporter periplasmic adaptor subunit [Allohahella marinimesophila]|uniref:Efflux RND transporter periplasmic adaptor subunit n=1 Tax=Allohahella marinimesophila TaxID=1054972 RepID=A0ABP7P034_9GAMM